MVLQFEVPGTQTSMLTKAALTAEKPSPAAGPAFTVIGATFAPEVVITLLVLEELPPPQPTEKMLATLTEKIRNVLSSFIGYPQHGRP
jgi:hypothetical protein